MCGYEQCRPESDDTQALEQRALIKPDVRVLIELSTHELDQQQAAEALKDYQDREQPALRWNEDGRPPPTDATARKAVSTRPARIQAKSAPSTQVAFDRLGDGCSEGFATELTGRVATEKIGYPLLMRHELRLGHRLHEGMEIRVVVEPGTVNEAVGGDGLLHVGRAPVNGDAPGDETVEDLLGNVATLAAAVLVADRETRRCQGIELALDRTAIGRKVPDRTPTRSGFREQRTKLADTSFDNRAAGSGPAPAWTKKLEVLWRMLFEPADRAKALSI